MVIFIDDFDSYLKTNDRSGIRTRATVVTGA